jgi:(S)-mandelate dehydrogenase
MNPTPHALRRVANIADLRLMARRNLPRMVFDYIDGDAGDGATARRNREGFDRFVLLPEALVDVAHRSTATTVLGQAMALPMVVGPTGLNGAYWPRGDLCLARAAHAAGVPFVMSTAATERLDTVAAVAGPARWFQLYMMKDRGLVGALLERVHAAGFGVLQLTVDTPVAGRRNRDIRNGFTLPFRWTQQTLLDTATRPRWALSMLVQGTPTLRLFEEVTGPPPVGATISEVMQAQLSSSFAWTDLDWLRAQWPGQLVLKGIANAAQVEHALAAGVNGVVVSNHGGRQLDGGRSAIEVLPDVAAAAAGRLAVLIDSGFRSGTDVAKAIALGADAVQLGRATLYGLAAAGEAGAHHALNVMGQEFDRAMALCGATSPQALRGRCVPV